MKRPLILFASVCSVMLFMAGYPFAEAAGEEVEVSIHYSRFVPDELTVRVGQAVTFVIDNTDPIDHEFILGDEAVQLRHELGTEPRHDEIPTEVSVPAKETITTTIVFDEPGTLIIGCHLPGHYDYGMRASVTVRT